MMEVSNPRRELIREMILTGQTQVAIAEALNMRPASVWKQIRTLRREGRLPPPAVQHGPKGSGGGRHRDHSKPKAAALLTGATRPCACCGRSIRREIGVIWCSSCRGHRREMDTPYAL